MMGRDQVSLVPEGCSGYSRLADAKDNSWFMLYTIVIGDGCGFRGRDSESLAITGALTKSIMDFIVPHMLYYILIYSVYTYIL